MRKARSPPTGEEAEKLALAFHTGSGAAAAAAAADGSDGEAAQAFDGLAAAARESAPVKRRRAVVATVLAAGVVIVAAVLAALLSRARARAPGRYPAVLHGLPDVAEHCDDELGKTHPFTGKRVVGQGLCADHKAIGLIALEPLALGELAFLVIGDWGRDGMCCQRDVALEMASAAKFMKPAFVANLGDSFYPAGIRSATDVQWNTSWRDVYITPYETMQTIPWKSVAGNHDYLGSIPAQLEFGKADPLWHFPSRYYFEDIEKGKILLAFLDTTTMYYSERELRDFEASSGVSLSIKLRDQQIDDLKKRLSLSNAKVKLVFGHHPLFSTSSHAIESAENAIQMQNLLLSVFVDNHVTAYFAGHEHTMEHSIRDGVHFFVVGSGSKMSGIEVAPKETVFAASSQGHVAGSVSGNVLRVRMVDFKGVISHAVDITV